MHRIELYFLLSHRVLRVDLRGIVRKIIFIIRNDHCGRDARREFRSHKTIYNRFISRRWLGVFKKNFCCAAAED